MSRSNSQTDPSNHFFWTVNNFEILESLYLFRIRIFTGDTSNDIPTLGLMLSDINDQGQLFITHDVVAYR